MTTPHDPDGRETRGAEATGTRAAPNPLRDIGYAGALTGILGGLVMAILAMLAAGHAGLSVLAPARFVAASLVGPAAAMRASSVLLGLLVHFAIAMALGVLYACAITRRTLPFDAFLGGLFFGIGTWLAMVLFVIPLANPALSARLRADGGFFFFAHLIFGATLAFLLPIREKLAEV